MILDSQNLFSDAQEVTDSAASENYINFGQREMAFGTPVNTIFRVVEAFEGGTSLALSIQTASDAAFSSPVTLVSTAAIAVADLVEGYEFAIKQLPAGNLGYMRAYYTADGEFTAGAITGGVVSGVQEGHHNLPDYSAGT